VLDALLAEPDIEVIAACREPSRLPPGFAGKVRQGDLTDRRYTEEVVQGVDVVCHTAAWTSLWAHRNEEEHLFGAPSRALIDAAVAAGVQRFVFDSSVVAAGPHRDGTAIGDREPGRHTGFWPHLDTVVDIENHMRAQSQRGTGMVVLRCGHFAGQRYNLGLLSLLVPRLKTHLVPRVAGARARVPLVDGRDLGTAFALAARVGGLHGFECFNICGPSFPAMHELIDFLHVQIEVPRPHFGVPLSAAYAFGWLMETLNPVLPGDPFLTRAIVYLGEDWYAPSDLASQRLGYTPQYDWQTAVRRQLGEMQDQDYPRTSLVDGTRWWAR
jgi:nucleoside-diphosphate-sugar epimerase